MSQKHLYGIDYLNDLNPPIQWKETSIDSTINDDAVEASINSNIFVFTGPAADFITDWAAQYGPSQGVPYRITMISEITGASAIVFDGFINLWDREILSESGPTIYRAPIVDLTNNTTVFDRLSVISQGLLVKQGFITSSDAVDIAVIRESKKNIAERTLILGQLAYDAITLFIQAIQNLMSALSDIVGVSAPVGVVELLLFAVNFIIELQLLVDNFAKHRDLLFPSISYYKGMSIKTTLEKAFLSLGMTVEFDTLLDSKLSNTYLMPSQDNNDGFPAAGFPFIGTLNTRDSGYFIGELIQTVQDFGNTRQDVRGTVAHMRNRNDPFWTTSPAFQPDNVKLETTLQYQNGIKKEDTARIDAAVFISYQYDPTDTHTLTENNDDSYEIHREPIIELDPRMSLMKGLKEIQIPYAIGVRKQPFDNLWDLFGDLTAESNGFLTALQDQITTYSSQLAGAGVDISAILAATPFGAILENRTGVLKIDDNSFGIAKMIYMTQTSNGLRIPENHKDFIGAKAIYVDSYLSDSPADVNEFKGQYINWVGWRIPFGVDNFIQTKLNPYFEIDSINAKFTSINWIEDEHQATTNAELNKPFDTNITEFEI